MPIRVLDAETVGRIAAGEVVERPASIAKELVENALDAGSTAITVEIKEGGTSFLRVTDNGCGIPAQDARLAFENHATSKILSGDALLDIRTLGFRGEALSSIAAVSRVTMTTRERGSEAGVKLTVEGGKVASIAEAGCPEGTTLVVSDLFFNTPARREFLKKPSYEAGVVAETVSRLILGNPGVSIRLISNGRTVYHSFGDGNLRHAALAIYGRETAEQLLEVDLAQGGLRVYGLIGVGELGRGSRSSQSFFVNGRAVRCPPIAQALEAAARGRVTVGQYPMCALNIVLPSNAVDVNVHPNKLEVRFRDEGELRAGVSALLEEALTERRMLDESKLTAAVALDDRPVITVEGPKNSGEGAILPSNNGQTEVFEEEGKVGLKETGVESSDSASNAKAFSIEKKARSKRQKSVSDIQSSLFSDPTPSNQGARLHSPARGSGTYIAEKSARVDSVPDSMIAQSAGQESPSEPSALISSDLPSMRLIGTFLNTYLLLEFGESLLLIDQHAAHERILYEQYQRAIADGTVMQQLLIPLILPMSPRERAALLNGQQALLEAGYEIEPFGERDVRVRAVPFVLGEASLKPIFVELCDRLDTLKTAAREKQRTALIMAACKHAVKAGDVLTEREINALIEEMHATGAPPTCPHGRPVVKVFRKAELEAMFKRN